MAQPDFQAIYEALGSGYGWDYGALAVDLAPIGLVTGTNPPYTATDFLGFYPKFGGTPLAVTGTLTNGSPTVTDVVGSGAGTGQLITGTGIPGGTTIISVNGSTLTLSQNATADGPQALTVYTAPFVPLVVLNAYINLASASLVQARWLDAWQIAMGLYVAHYVTLYLRSDGNVYSDAGKAAAAGLNVGITVSKGAGPVSQGLQLSSGLENWGEWQTTAYGRQFATMAKVVGSGPVLVR